jgi:hypothetical protein
VSWTEWWRFIALVFIEALSYVMKQQLVLVMPRETTKSIPSALLMKTATRPLRLWFDWVNPKLQADSRR